MALGPSLDKIMKKVGKTKNKGGRQTLLLWLWFSWFLCQPQFPFGPFGPFGPFWGWNWVGLGWDWVWGYWGLRGWGLGLDNIWSEWNHSRQIQQVSVIKTVCFVKIHPPHTCLCLDSWLNMNEILLYLSDNINNQFGSPGSHSLSEADIQAALASLTQKKVGGEAEAAPARAAEA